MATITAASGPKTRKPWSGGALQGSEHLVINGTNADSISPVQAQFLMSRGIPEARRPMLAALLWGGIE